MDAAIGHEGTCEHGFNQVGFQVGLLEVYPAEVSASGLSAKDCPRKLRCF